MTPKYFYISTESAVVGEDDAKRIFLETMTTIEQQQSSKRRPPTQLRREWRCNWLLLNFSSFRSLNSLFASSPLWFVAPIAMQKRKKTRATRENNDEELESEGILFLVLA